MDNPGLFARIISRAHPEDPQAVIVLGAALILVGGLAGLMGSVIRGLWLNHEPGYGTCFLTVAAILALFGIAKIKPPFSLPNLPPTPDSQVGPDTPKE